MKQKRDELILEFIRKRMSDENDRRNSLDNKAGNLIGFISVVVGLLLGSGGVGLFSGASGSALLSDKLFSVVYFVGIGGLLISIGFALSALKVREWTTVPNVTTLIHNYIDLPYSQVIERNSVEMANAVTSSEKGNNEKAKLVAISWHLLIVGLCIVFASLIVSIT